MKTFTLDTLDDGPPPEPKTPSRTHAPRLTILYSPELGRIGAATPPAVFEKGKSVVVGRASPVFESPQHPGAVVAPLADPYLSRSQALVRWDGERHSFEVTPDPNAKRKVHRLIETDAGLVLRPIEGTVHLPPGSALAFGQRVLLGLDLAPWHPASEDRLGMVGESQAMWSLRARISQVAAFDGAALILGETGVGKERVARAIHGQSARASGPFVAINCAALPLDLAEGMLFGYKKGIFTGAAVDHPGLFVEAHGGTLLLDELGELPMAIQAKLLRVLQDGRVLPLGKAQERAVDVRVLAATHRVPKDEIDAGRLRPDLYYRLATHTLEVPPLRGRRGDVPMLLMHFLGGFRRAHPALGWLWQSPAPKRPGLPLDCAVSLIGASWPGNVRELESVAEQIASLNVTPSAFQMPPGLAAAPPARPTARLYSEALAEASAALKLTRKVAIALLPESILVPLDTRARAERVPLLSLLDGAIGEHLYNLLAERDHNQTALAQALDVSRTTLVKLMRRFGLRRPGDFTDAQLMAAWRDAGGDATEMARALRVSPLALKTHLTKSGLIGS